MSTKKECVWKKMITKCFLVVMVVVGIAVFSKSTVFAEANERTLDKYGQEVTVIDGKEAETGVIYSNGYKWTNYWSQADKAVPVKKGYVFGGWYRYDQNSKEPFTPMKKIIYSEDKTIYPGIENIWAKFVPEELLSIKIQILSKTQNDPAASTKTSMRILSGVDHVWYRQVGFEVLLGNAEEPLVVDAKDTVYETIRNSPGGEAIPASDIFGEAANYISTIILKDIEDESFGSKIYIRPYWRTVDGTRVVGQAQMVRVEDRFDEYNYVRVPLNFWADGNNTNTNPLNAATGMVVVNYDKAKVDLITAEVGRLMPQMTIDIDENKGQVIFVGNVRTVGTDVRMNDIFANLRFKALANDRSAETIIQGITTEFYNWDDGVIVTENIRGLEEKTDTTTNNFSIQGGN